MCDPADDGNQTGELPLSSVAFTVPTPSISTSPASDALSQPPADPAPTGDALIDPFDLPPEPVA